ncbi:hypothetical protein Tco_1483647 [Tanacetum coccineum]
MAPETSTAVVPVKFDMHVYRSEITSDELKKIVVEHCIPSDLRPRLPHPDMTMNKLPAKHGDTDLRDDFSTNYNVNDAARLSDFVILLRPTPCHMLYECGLTTACRHPELAYNIKDKDGNGNLWVKNLEKPNPKIVAAREKSEQKSLARAATKRAASRKKRKVHKNQEDIGSRTEETLSPTPLRQAAPVITKEPVIHTAANVPKGPPEINHEVVNLSEGTPPASAHRVSPPPEQHDTREHAALDAHSFHSSHHQDADESTLVPRYMPNWDLRNDLRVCTFRACKELVSHLATPAEDEFLGGLSNVEVISRAYQTLGQSVLAQGELLKRHEQLNHDYVDLRNRNDVNVTELEDLRSSLQREKQANADLSKEFALLDSAHVGCSNREREFMDRLKDMEKDRDEWRQTASDQVERIRSLEVDLVPTSQQLAAEREKVCVLEGEKDALSADLAREKRSVSSWFGSSSRRCLGRTEDEITAFLTQTEDLDIEGSKTWQDKHRQLFIMSYPYVQKIANSADLPFAELLKVTHGVPLSTSKEGGSAAEGNVPPHPPNNQESSQPTTFGTTT